MIKAECFSLDWLDSFRKQPEYKRIQTNVLEKMIHALYLLEQLKSNGLRFVFKGGTCLVLLLEEDNRFSIDIDIICKIDRSELEAILNNVIDTSRFTKVSLDQHRSYKSGVPKAHYKFQFDSVFNTRTPPNILLDILIEDSIYPEHVESAIQTKWIASDTETLVTTPTIDAITGDKLTAFAPNTIGIPYYKGEQSCATEICKQLFDISRLFENIADMGVVDQSFRSYAAQEIEYRKNVGNLADLTNEIVLQDTINTCKIIATRGAKNDEQDKSKLEQLQQGIKSFGSGYLMTGNFRIDDAVAASARVAYLSAKLLMGDLSPINYYNGEDIGRLIIECPDWNILNRLKRQPDKSSFYYWYYAVHLLTKVS